MTVRWLRGVGVLAVFGAAAVGVVVAADAAAAPLVHKIAPTTGPTAVPTGSAGYVAVAPCRIVDTRVAGGALATDGQRSFRVTGTGLDSQGGAAAGCGVPAGAQAVEASVTAVGPSGNGYARVWPAGQSMPNATFLNFTAGRSVTNTGSLSLATSGASQLSLANTGGTTDYVIDVAGYFTSADADSAGYVPVTPCRIVDTRLAGGALTTRATRSFRVTGTGLAPQGGAAGGCGVPAAATAVVASVTAVDPSANGYARVWPAGQAMPNATLLNFSAGQSITNTGALSLATGPGGLSLGNFGATTHYVIDVAGYYTEAAAATAGYVPVRPCRIVDTRVAGGALAAGTTRSFRVAGSGLGVQGGSAAWCGVPGGAVAAVASVTAVGPSASGYARVWPAGQAMPNATMVNFSAGQSITNTGVVSLATVGANQLSLANFGGSTHYVIDVAGYYTAATVPRAPAGVTATAGNSSAEVSWTPPVFNGGLPITGYIVTPYVGATALTPRTFDASTTTRTITGLTNGTTYTFRVAAKNVVGSGPKCSPSTAVTPPGSVEVPGAPTDVLAEAGDGQATVSWTAPGSDGGAAITGYIVTPYDGEGTQAETARSFDSTATSQIITGLTNDRYYTFRVAAQNAEGTGDQSELSNYVLLPGSAEVPGAPTGVTAEAGDGQATVSWAAPGSDGGAAITGYVVTPYLGGREDCPECSEWTIQDPITFNSTQTNQTLTGLLNGRRYTFTVAAQNAGGTGTPSDQSNAVTPTGTPQAPTNVIARAFNGEAFIEWTAIGGSPATSYIVTPYIGLEPQPSTTFDAPSYGEYITPLTNYTTYTFTVAAQNANGTSPQSNPSNAVTPVPPPQQPIEVQATAGNGQATVSWTQPEGAPVSDYAITPFIGSQQFDAIYFDGSSTTVTITGLTNGTTYTFAVTAMNAGGSSLMSDRSNAVTPTAVVGGGFIPTCADVVGESVACWGSHDAGELGDGTTTDASTPVSVTGTTALDAAPFPTWALVAAGALRCRRYDDDFRPGGGANVVDPGLGARDRRRRPAQKGRARPHGPFFPWC
ncbi:MAG: hypothetical protein JWM47_1948 [Acidimicrobiales bacterium]|nr:hypothetical protein [Acidimicrobiales bacterium]